MSDGYGIDLEAYSLQALYDHLVTATLMPGHRPLLENIEEQFSALASHGIRNAQQIVDALTTKKAQEKFAAETGIPLDYLTLLRRHVRGNIPNPIEFAEIPGLDSALVERLAAAGLKHTRHFYDRARTRETRAALSQQTGLTSAEMLELLRLTDLSRLGWIGPVGVRLFLEAGATSVETLAGLDPDAFYDQLMAVNREKQFTRATITRRDIGLVLETARKLPPTVEY
jgi:hypothetical protein